ncbi:MAG: flavoprotein [Planctomycetota bacterium]|jgi:phosphopantothenoylcysteine decarboxylase/phosphopantothenate--cysteine ligase
MPNRRIVVGVSGGIAAYKSATIVSKWVQAGHHVTVVMTKGASQFIGPATFTALCGEAPATDPFDTRYPLGPHIELARDCDLFLVAPATARIVASCALGLANDLLSTLYLNMECPMVFAPAMSKPMWDKPSVQRNISLLESDGVQMIGPESGWQSCRRRGIGRMSEPEAIMEACQSLLE